METDDNENKSSQLRTNYIRCRIRPNWNRNSIKYLAQSGKTSRDKDMLSRKIRRTKIFSFSRVAKNWRVLNLSLEIGKTDPLRLELSVNR